VLAHIAYERQRQIKSDIIADAFRRIGRITLETATEVVASPSTAIACARACTCATAASGSSERHALAVRRRRPAQLRDDTIAVVRRLEASLATSARERCGDRAVREYRRLGTRDSSRAAAERDPSRLAGAGAGRRRRPARPARHGDNPRTIDLSARRCRRYDRRRALSRHVASFFQGNRFLTTRWSSTCWPRRGGADPRSLRGCGLFSVTAAARRAGT
jgi:hypothetical protein